MRDIGMNGGQTLRSHGLTLAPGNGPDEDYEIVTARKSHPCDHHRAQGGRLGGDCTGTIAKGKQYARARQSWREWATVSIRCLTAGGVLVSRPSDGRTGLPAGLRTSAVLPHI